MTNFSRALHIGVPVWLGRSHCAPALYLYSYGGLAALAVPPAQGWP